MYYPVTALYISTSAFTKTAVGTNLIFDTVTVSRGGVSFIAPSSDIIVNEIGTYELNITNLQQGLSVWINDGINPAYEQTSSKVIDSSTQMLINIRNAGTVINLKNISNSPAVEITLSAGIQLTLSKILSDVQLPYSNVTVLQPEQTVIADSVPNSVAVQPYTAVPNQIAQQGYDGWYFTNSVTGEYINWYMPTPYLPNGTPLTVNDLDNLYATFKVFSAADLPFINIYTEIGSGGQDPAQKGGSFYQSRFQYNPAIQYSTQIATQVATAVDLAGNFLGANVNILAQVPKVNANAPLVTNHTNYAVTLAPLSLVGGGSRGTLNGAEKIIAISINTNTAAAPSTVKFIAQSVFVSETLAVTSNQFSFLNETVVLKDAPALINGQFNIAQNDEETGKVVLPLSFFTFDSVNPTNTTPQLEYIAGNDYISVLADCNVSIDFNFTTTSSGPLSVQIQNGMSVVPNGKKVVPIGFVGETSIKTNFSCVAGDRITIYNSSIDSEIALFGSGSASLSVTTS